MSAARSVLLYDGDCGFCRRWVRFAGARDRRECFRFVPLQAEEGATLLRGCGMDAGRRDTIVLIDPDGRCTMRSTAALRVAKRLRGPVRLLYAFVVVPRPVRDRVYDWVGRNRHRF